ncbi:MAG: galactose oxidase-like domain-containing protein, partial [Acidimicrobiales bacterium]
KGSVAVPFGTGVVAVHAALLRTGEVLAWSFSDSNDAQGDSRVVNPASGALTTQPDAHHIFCSGHAFLPDGRLVVAGGHHHDVKAIHTFDPATNDFEHVADMAAGRWYPTCATLADGRVLIVSGTVHGGPVAPGNPVNNTLQHYDGAALSPAVALPTPFSPTFPPSLGGTIDLYPFVFQLPSGKVAVHSRTVTRFYDPSSGGWGPGEVVANHPFSRTYPGEGGCALLGLMPATTPPYRARMLITGGGGAAPEELQQSTPATGSTEVLDLGEPGPAWRVVGSLKFPRIMPDAVLLPDGKVAVVGGSSAGRADTGIDPVFPIEIFDPVAETWSTAASTRVPRLYHSTALLLPDARVMIMGKDGLFNADPYKYPEHRAEVFSPPYLFAGPRPEIAGAPEQVAYATEVEVASPAAAGVASAVLVRAGSVTHSFNMDQRLVGLVIAARSSGSLVLEMPPGGNVAPPGWYLLFLLTPSGVPSVGRFVRLGP